MESASQFLSTVCARAQSQDRKQRHGRDGVPYRPITQSKPCVLWAICATMISYIMIIESTMYFDVIDLTASNYIAINSTLRNKMMI